MRRNFISFTAMLILDALLINLSFILASVLYFRVFELTHYRILFIIEEYSTFLIFITFVWLAIFSLLKLYEEKTASTELDEAASIFAATTLGALLLLGMTLMHKELLFTRKVITFAWLLSTILISFSRIFMIKTIKVLRRNGVGVKRTLIIGAGNLGQAISHRILENPELGCHLVGLVDDDPQKQGKSFGGARVLGRTADIRDIIRKYRINEVILAISKIDSQRILDFISQCETETVEFKMVPGLLEILASRVSTDDLDGIPLISVREIQLYGFNAALKRAMDFTSALGTLILLSPLMLLTAALIKIDSPGHLIYAQERIGKDGKTFKLYKFRTMVADADKVLKTLLNQNEQFKKEFEENFKLRDDPRITRIGKILRPFSLDELPQFFNVLKGDMSMVGPRPIIKEELMRYGSLADKLLHIQPGVTGLWQISGRSDIPYEERVKLDIYYIENWSLWADIKIILRTVPVVLSGGGAY